MLRRRFAVLACRRLIAVQAASTVATWFLLSHTPLQTSLSHGACQIGLYFIVSDCPAQSRESDRGMTAALHMSIQYLSSISPLSEAERHMPPHGF